MAEISKTFSDLWYRVADFRPRLSPHLIVRRHTYRRTTWFVLGDPASSKFYRFNAAAYRFLGLLDGRRTVNEAWDVCNAQLGDEAPTQRDCLDLLAQLQMFGLMRNDLPVDSNRLRERLEDVKEQRYAELTGNYLFWTVPIFNPERFLAKFANIARVVFSKWGIGAFVILLLIAIRAIIPRADELASTLNRVISPDNLVLLSLSFLGLKAMHELGHAFSCKAYGGRVTEIGIMFMIVIPIPYCDATASWAFPSKWRRILVAGAGMMTELSIASVAALIWANSEAGLLHTLTYNIMFVASVTTVLFNINPLLRYDGYYMLADFLEIPNLATRSYELLKWMVNRFAFGLKGEPMPPLHSIREAAAMIIHATLSLPYRVLVMVSIVLFVAQRYFVFGLLLGFFGTVMWILVPVIKGYAYVLSDPKIQVVRPRGVVTTFGFTAIVVGFFGFLPLPAHVTASAVIDARDKFTFRAPDGGFVTDIRAVNDQWLHKGDPICTLFSAELIDKYEKAQAGVLQEKYRSDGALGSSPVEYKLSRPMMVQAQRSLAVFAQKVSEMRITAPISGRFIAPDFDTRAGAYFEKGATLGVVATLDDMVLRAYVDDADFAWLFPRGIAQAVRDGSVSAQARLYDDLGKVHDLTIDVGLSGLVGDRSIDFTQLAHSVEGGSITVDPTDPQRRKTLSPQWMVTLRIRNNGPAPASSPQRANGLPDLIPGTRAVVRFTAPSEPLILQWYRLIVQNFHARFKT